MFEIKIQVKDDGTVSYLYEGETDLEPDEKHRQHEIWKFIGVFSKAIERFAQNRESYGDSWSLTEFKHHEALLTAMVCLVKSKRICNMLDKENGVSEKHADQLLENNIHLMNYANFLYQSIKKQIPDK